MKIKKIARFLHVTDSDGNLDLIDLSFVGTVIKVLMSPGIDFPSVCSLIGLIMAKMHRYHLENRNGKDVEVEETETT